MIEEPVLRLTSVDLGCSAEISSLNEVFDFGKDHLGLLKAAVIASGIVPPGIEGSGQSLADFLARILGPGRGLELVSNVNNIPKGSRLAVSTNLLAALIGVCMRATGQAGSLTGPLEENERRIVLARALLGEWIGGSGGGWQDSGGVWPGMKVICCTKSEEGDAEFGISRGRLMPTHRILDTTDVPADARQKLQDSLVLVHGGMAQNVGPILEMVTEKYLLRSGPEWIARQQTHEILDRILHALHSGDIPAIGAATMENFRQPLQAIIPWASNLYTETLIEKISAEFGEDFWGFWMLGGMAGGGMGFIFAPQRKAQGQQRLQQIMSEKFRDLGLAALKNGEVAVVTLAAGAGSRWTQGARVVKALHPFCKLGGRHRSFIETHLANSRKTGRLTGTSLPHIFTTSYFSHDPTERFLAEHGHCGYDGPLFLSQGKSIGLRTVPTVRDLRFAWEEMPQQLLDVQQHLLDPDRRPARRLPSHPRRSNRCRKSQHRHPRPRRKNADLHHPQGGQKTLEQRPGGHFPRLPI